MDIDLLDKFKYLPDDIICLIISYTGCLLVYRNGVFRIRFAPSDNRYKLLSRLFRPIIIREYEVLFRLIGQSGTGYFLLYNNRFFTMNVRTFYKDIDGFDSFFNIKTNYTYKFIYDKWVQI